MIRCWIVKFKNNMPVGYEWMPLDAFVNIDQVWQYVLENSNDSLEFDKLSVRVGNSYKKKLVNR